jgi:transposase
VALQQGLAEAVAGPNAKAAGVCHEWRKVWPARWTVALIEGVEPTNHAAARALRPAVRWRKGSFGTHSPAGRRCVARRRTVTATGRQQERPLLDFLVATLEAARRNTSPPSLLPTHAP